MSLYSQQVSNNPLALDGLLTGSFDVLYVDGQPIVPTNTSGLVPYTGATTAVDLNNKKITTTYTAVNAEDLTKKGFTDATYVPYSGATTTVNLNSQKIITTYVPVNNEDLTNKGYTDGIYLPRTGFNVSSGGFVFSGTSIVYLHSGTNIVASTSTPSFSLGIDATNNLIKFAGGIGDAVLAGGTALSPQYFSGYNTFANVINTNTINNTSNFLTTGGIQFSGAGLSAGTATSFLGINSSGTVSTTTTTGIPTQINLTSSTSNVEYYPVFVTLFSSGIQTVFNMTGLTFNPNTTILTTTKLKITNVPAGTQQHILAVDSAGNVIQGTVTSVPTQINPTPINSSIVLYPVFLNSIAGGASTTYVESDGSLFYNPFNNNLTVGNGAIICNTLQSQAGSTLTINAIGNGQLLLQSASATVARLDGLGLYINEIQTIDPVNDMNIYATTTTSLNLWSGGNIAFSATPEGTWMPVSGSKSFYITDTAPRTATTTYYRLFGVGGTVYNDFHNTVMWRALNLAGTTGPNAMYLRSSGLNIPLSSSTHTTLDAYELVVGDNSGTTNKSAKIMIRGKANYFNVGQGPSIDFTAWDSHATPQASIEVVDDNNWGGIFQFRSKANGAGSAGALTKVLAMDTSGFIFFCPSQGASTDYQYTYASDTTTTNPYKICQNQIWQFNQDGVAWSGGVVLGSIFKLDVGSKLSWVASGTQYTSGGAGTLIFQVAFTLVSTGVVYAYNQNTFTNVGGVHWVCPNINMVNSLPAGTYAVSASGNVVSDANDYLRVQVRVSP